MDSEGKADQVSDSPSRDQAGSRASQDVEDREGEDKETMASSKEAALKGGTDNSSPKGKKRATSDDPETMASKRGKKSSSEGPAPGRSRSSTYIVFSSRASFNWAVDCPGLFCF